MTQNNRKRGRNPKEEEMEFMPLSKRINNLHINTSMILDNARLSNSLNNVEWGPGPPNILNYLPESPPSSEQSVDLNILHYHQNDYSPDLTESENPHYFKINKLLFEMYIERMQRGCHNT
ncbi:uncharacterized protein LOC130895688 [Diorhabda carinulata]|uniref:uncharacterized protein LOC130448211 n=1 Tax=Diorhabda sublineata TaxID=1163346 RepID=UPI0024E132E7|nr:uncharacterized protein LOC130448211 [Diorhabda sublineata]XP_057659136.1 uncharacterized protein LOC130895688 [Diorhabda carinulata]